MNAYREVLVSIGCSLAGMLLLSTAFGQEPSSPGTEARATTAELPGAARERIEDLLRRDALAARPLENGSFRLENPGHVLSARICEKGIFLQSSPSNDAAWDLRLSWSGCRRESSADDGSGRDPATVHADGSRVEIRRGAITEWYVNDERGIEQGVTLDAAPGGTGPLVVEWRMEGTLAPGVAEESDAFVFRDAAGGSALRYSGLYAIDADGTSLSARLGLQEDRLRITVDDEGARYPVTIDPWFRQAELTPSDAVDWGYFGHSVDISGDTIAVGAYGWDSHRGAVYVFEKPAGAWSDMTQTAKLTASDGAWGFALGWSVAIDGDVIVAGSPFKNGGVGSSAGGAYAFVKPPGGWVDAVESAILVSSDIDRYDQFGCSIDVSGNTVAVGAEGSANNTGAAYVFVEPGGGWSGIRNEAGKLLAGDAAMGDYFGFSIGTTGERIVVGAMADTIGSANAQGSAYVFVRPGAGWNHMTHTAKLLASDGEAADILGRSAAIDGDTVIVGAYGDDGNTGAAYVFVEPPGGWVDTTQTAKLTAADADLGHQFGVSVAIRDGTVVVGADYDDELGMQAGAAYFFEKPVGGWIDATSSDKVFGGTSGYLDLFGCSVSIDGGTAVVGAWAMNGLGFQSGKAFVFVPGVAASATFRNAGTNPASHDAVTLPVLGATYTATIDLGGTTGHPFAWLVGYSTPLTLPLGSGPTLLVNVTDAAGELLGQSLVAGPVATYDLPIPPDILFMGFPVATQALHWGGGPPFDLSNAQDLILGT